MEPDITELAGHAVSLFILVAIWELAWKGVAVWKAARAGHMKWFIAILVINSLGLLPIIYIYLAAPRLAKKKAEAE